MSKILLSIVFKYLLFHILIKYFIIFFLKLSVAHFVGKKCVLPNVIILHYQTLRKKEFPYQTKFFINNLTL